MKTVFFKSIRKATLLILIFSITALMLTSFFPIVKQKISNESPQYLYYSKDTLNENDNDLSNVINKLNIILLLLWLIIIIGIIAFLGIIITISKKKNPSPILFFIISTIIFISSIIIIIQGYSIEDNISKINDISLVYIFNPFSFFYIIIIFYFFTLISSIYFIIGVSIYIVKSYEINNKEDKSNAKDKKPKKVSFFKTKSIVLNDISNNLKTKDNYKIISEAEVWDFSDEEIKKSQKKTDINDNSNTKSEIEEIENLEKNLIEKESVELEEINDDEKKDSFTNHDISPFKDIKSGEKNIVKQQEPTSNDKDTTQNVSNFEKALSSAIKKKQHNEKKNVEDLQQNKPQINPTIEEKAIDNDKELSKDELINKNISPFNENKKEKIQIEKQFNVRCPLCNNIFLLTKRDKKIKCPFCNAEGVIE